jgi:hypothetical protein
MTGISTKSVLLAAALLAGSLGMAQAQTASDGSTSPGGLVTESGGALQSFMTGGDDAPYASGPYAYNGGAYGRAFAYDPHPYHVRRAGRERY